MALFSLLALLLAAVGVYGVVAYGVSQQTREFGLRIALGATPRDLLSAVLRQGLMMVGAGVALGSIVAFVTSRFIAGALFGIGPGDPVTYASAAGLLIATGLAASRVQPVMALRVE